MPAPARIPLYLPITAVAATRFFDLGEVPELAVERAGLFVALSAQAAAQEHTSLQVMLTRAEELFIGAIEEGKDVLLDGRRKSGAPAGRVVLQQLAIQGITFAPDELMYTQAWRGPDGRYTFEFQQRCRGSMQPFEISMPVSATPHDEGEYGDDDYDEPESRVRRDRPKLQAYGTRDQHVVASAISAAADDHVFVSAYAGTGKTHFIHSLTGVLSSRFTYVAPTEAHLFGFKVAAQRSGNKVRCITLWGLATEMAKIHARAARLGYTPRIVRSDYDQKQQAHISGIGWIGNHSPESVVRTAHRIIGAWCQTDGPVLTVDDVVRTIGEADEHVLEKFLDACLAIWNAMFVASPVRGVLFSVRTEHLVKWLMLGRATVPTSYGTLIVDEAHDLQIAWQPLLARYPGGCIMLGDPNQRLRGDIVPYQTAKQLWMGQSVRIGNGVEQLIRTALHQGGNDPRAAEFAASRAHITARRPFDAEGQVPDSGLRVFGDPGSLADALFRLGADRCRVGVLPASLKDTYRHLLRLGDAHRKRGRDGDKAWAAEAAYLERVGADELLARLEAGLVTEEIDALVQSTGRPEDSQLVFGLVEHCKNIEMDVVSLHASCFDSRVGARHFNPARAIYQGMSRARHELWLPGSAMERMLAREVHDLSSLAIRATRRGRAR